MDSFPLIVIAFTILSRFVQRGPFRRVQLRKEMARGRGRGKACTSNSEEKFVGNATRREGNTWLPYVWGPLYKYIIKVPFEGQAFFQRLFGHRFLPEKLKHLESTPQGEPLEPGVTYIPYTELCEPPLRLASILSHFGHPGTRYAIATLSTAAYTTTRFSPANLMRLQRASRI